MKMLLTTSHYAHILVHARPQNVLNSLSVKYLSIITPGCVYVSVCVCMRAYV